MVRLPASDLGGLISLLLLCPTNAFYVPGYSIKSYKQGESIPLMVNKAYSDSTQLQYAYYDLPFVCQPSDKPKSIGGLLSGKNVPLNLGEVLRGDRIRTSDIQLAMGKDTECKALCTKQVSLQDLKWTKQMIRDSYVTEWIVDNLPGATSFVSVDKTRKYYASGFKLGYSKVTPSTGKTQYYLNNHHTIVIRYRKAPGRAGQRGENIIVGFEVYPKSIGRDHKRDVHGCPIDLQNVEEGFELRIGPNTTTDAAPRYADASSSRLATREEEEGDSDTLSIPYTYSVYFREDNGIEWSHRWDLYFVNQEDGARIHWLAIINSLIICGMLTAIVMIIFARTVYSDIRGYKDTAESKVRRQKVKKEAPGGLLGQSGDASLDADLSDSEEALEDVTGWKLLHGDVFRSPQRGYLLAPLVGSGMQLLFMATGLVLLSALGFLNPSFRGGFISVGVGLFVFAGVFSGYFSARVFKSFDGKDYRKNAMVTALLFPGLMFGLVFMINLFVWAQASSTAIPFGSLVLIVVLWLCFQVPLVYAGSYYGFEKAGRWQHPTKATALPRQLPTQAWYSKSTRAALVAGLIPFAVIFIELLFVFQSLWQNKSGYYYMFGFLAVVFVILIVTIAEVTVVTIYIQLCSENYHWWWQSFFVGGSSAVWVFAYSVWYYMFKLHITGFVSSLLFFAYSFVACCVYGLLTGTIGFLSAYTFVRRIYSSASSDYNASRRTEFAEAMDINEYREHAKKAVDQIADYYESIPSRPVIADVQPGYLRPLLPPSPPLEGEPMDAIAADIQSKILPGITHWAHPGFMAFFPATASHPANIAEMWSNAFNGAHFNWICSPAVTELETVVLDWLAGALALPDCFLSGGPTRGGGVLHGSASEAILTVMVAARDRYLARAAAARLSDGGGDGEDEREEELWRLRSRLVALGSAGAHSSTKKAAQVLGVRFDTVPVDEASGFAMTGEALAVKLAELRAKGLEPFYLTATLGTTDVCAVDDFAGIAATLAADAAKNNKTKTTSNGTTSSTVTNGDAAADAPGDIWVHVDAAFAGSALILPQYQHLTGSFSSFSSFNFNPHKWLLTTFDCSAVWVRSRADLVSALSIKPAYLRNQFSDAGDLVTDYRDWQIPLGRRFRSLKLWFVMRSYGVSGLRAHVQSGIDLAESLDAKMAARADLFTLFTRARFALLSFRVVGRDEEEVNRRTEALYERLNASGVIYLTCTVVNGKFAVRVSTSTAAVREEHVQKAFDLIVKETEALLAKE